MRPPKSRTRTASPAVATHRTAARIAVIALAGCLHTHPTRAANSTYSFISIDPPPPVHDWQGPCWQLTGGPGNPSGIPNAVGDTAAIDLPPGAWAIDINGAVTVGALAFTVPDGASLSLDPGVGGSLTLDGSAGRAFISSSGAAAARIGAPITIVDILDITTSGTGVLTLAGPISSSASLDINKLGSGTLLLSGNNSYTGLTRISEGTLMLGHANALGTAASATFVSSGASLDLNGQSVTLAEALNISGTGIASAGALVNSSGSAASWAGTVTLAVAGTAIGGSGDIRLNGALAGNYKLVKTGAGTLTLTKASTRNTGGTTQVDGGTLRLEHAQALSNQTGTAITVNADAALELAAGITLAQPITLATGAIVRSDGSASTSGTVQLPTAGAATVTFATRNAGDVFSIGTDMNKLLGGDGDETIRIAGPGAVRFGYRTTYKGHWLVTSGTLQAGVPEALGSTANTIRMEGGRFEPRMSSSRYFGHSITAAGPCTIAATGAIPASNVTYDFGNLALTGHTVTITCGENLTVSGGINFGTATLAADSTLNVVNSPAAATTATVGQLHGNHRLTKTGEGVLRLTAMADPSFAAGLTVDGGEVSIATSPDTLGSGAHVINAAGRLVVSIADGLGSGSVTINGGELWATVANALRSSAAGHPPLPIALNGGTLRLRSPANTAFHGDIVASGASTIVIDSPSPMSYIGDDLDALSLAGPLLRIEKTAVVSSATLNFGPTTVVSAATLELAGVDATVGALSGVGSLLKTGSGQLALRVAAAGFTGSFDNREGTTLLAMASNILGGPVAISGGTLQVESSRAAGTSAMTLASDGRLLVRGARGSTVAVPNNITIATAQPTIDARASSGTTGIFTADLGGELSVLSPLTVLSGPNAQVRIGGRLRLESSLQLSGGTLILDVAPDTRIAPSAAISVGVGAMLLADGANDPFSDWADPLSRVGVVNDGELRILSGAKRIGAVHGSGHIAIAPTASLAATGVSQSSLAVDGSLEAGDLAIAQSIIVGNAIDAAQLRASSLVAGSLTIRDRARVQVGSSALSVVEQLAFAGAAGAWRGQLDLTDGALLITYSGPSPLVTLSSLLRSGYNNGAWDGNGIVTTHAGGGRGLGIAEAAELGLSEFAGHPITGPTIVIRHTSAADANLDGASNLVDLTILLNNYNAAGRWTTGDFNHDGQVGFADLGLLLGAYQGAGGALDTPAITLLQQHGFGVIPEPSTAVLFLAASLLRRRRGCANVSRTLIVLGGAATMSGGSGQHGHPYDYRQHRNDPGL